MPELCAHCGELIDVEHQPHIAVYSEAKDEPIHIIGFLHLKCSNELETTKWKRRDKLLSD